MSAKPKPFDRRELADRLGHPVEYLYRAANMAKLYDAGLPFPLPGPGRPKWDRAKTEAWLAGETPLEAANDAGPVPEPRGDAAWRKHLSAAYHFTGDR
jgi:hypothetical protein